VLTSHVKAPQFSWAAALPVDCQFASDANGALDLIGGVGNCVVAIAEMRGMICEENTSL
jgi:hypothetical protein